MNHKQFLEKHKGLKDRYGTVKKTAQQHWGESWDLVGLGVPSLGNPSLSNVDSFLEEAADAAKRGFLPSAEMRLLYASTILDVYDNHLKRAGEVLARLEVMK